MNDSILSASDKDFEEILQLARSFDLDCEDIAWNQFVVSKQNNKIVGFGRLRHYSSCTEIATVGVTTKERNNNIGSSLIHKLIEIGPSEIYVTCVIPDFFRKLGFQTVQQYPAILQKKVDFCKLYDFSDEQIFVMKFIK